MWALKLVPVDENDAPTLGRGFYGRVPNGRVFLSGYPFVRVSLLSGWTDGRVDRWPGIFVPPDIMPSLQRGKEATTTLLGDVRFWPYGPKPNIT